MPPPQGNYIVLILVCCVRIQPEGVVAVITGQINFVFPVDIPGYPCVKITKKSTAVAYRRVLDIFSVQSE